MKYSVLFGVLFVLLFSCQKAYGEDVTERFDFDQYGFRMRNSNGKDLYFDLRKNTIDVMHQTMLGEENFSPFTTTYLFRFKESSPYASSAIRLLYLPLYTRMPESKLITVILDIQYNNDDEEAPNKILTEVYFEGINWVIRKDKFKEMLQNNSIFELKRVRNDNYFTIIHKDKSKVILENSYSYSYSLLVAYGDGDFVYPRGIYVDLQGY